MRLLRLIKHHNSEAKRAQSFAVSGNTALLDKTEFLHGVHDFFLSGGIGHIRELDRVRVRDALLLLILISFSELFLQLFGVNETLLLCSSGTGVGYS